MAYRCRSAFFLGDADQVSAGEREHIRVFGIHVQREPARSGTLYTRATQIPAKAERTVSIPGIVGQRHGRNNPFPVGSVWQRYGKLSATGMGVAVELALRPAQRTAATARAQHGTAQEPRLVLTILRLAAFLLFRHTLYNALLIRRIRHRLDYLGSGSLRLGLLEYLMHFSHVFLYAEIRFHLVYAV